MELAQLDAFITAADCGSFSRAAEMLNVAQPSLSNRIQSLEREVGQALFERMGRGVKLTDAEVTVIYRNRDDDNREIVRWENGQYVAK